MFDGGAVGEGEGGAGAVGGGGGDGEEEMSQVSGEKGWGQG